MAWYWPRIEDENSAEAATKPAVGASGFFAVVTGLLATLSLVYRRPVYGLSGGSIIDALVFLLIAWRINKMSRTWAILGLMIYLAEVAFSLLENPNTAIGLLTIIFVLAYVAAIRGTFAYNRYHQTDATTQSPSSPS
jgi:hypothetical protein